MWRRIRHLAVDKKIKKCNCELFIGAQTEQNKHNSHRISALLGISKEREDAVLLETSSSENLKWTQVGFISGTIALHDMYILLLSEVLLLHDVNSQAPSCATALN